MCNKYIYFHILKRFKKTRTPYRDYKLKFCPENKNRKILCENLGNNLVLKIFWKLFLIKILLDIGFTKIIFVFHLFFFLFYMRNKFFNIFRSLLRALILILMCFCKIVFVNFQLCFFYYNEQNECLLKNVGKNIKKK